MIQEGSKGPEHGGQGNNSLGASVLMEESLRMRKAGKQGRYWLKHFIKDLNFCQGCFLQTSISVSRALQLCSQVEWLSLGYTYFMAEETTTQKGDQANKHER